MKSPEEIEAIERDAAAGMNLLAIAKKHSISWATAKRYAPKAKSGRATKQPHVNVTNVDDARDLAALTETVDAYWNSLSLSTKLQFVLSNVKVKSAATSSSIRWH